MASGPPAMPAWHRSGRRSVGPAPASRNRGHRYRRGTISSRSSRLLLGWEYRLTPKALDRYAELSRSRSGPFLNLDSTDDYQRSVVCLYVADHGAVELRNRIASFDFDFAHFSDSGLRFPRCCRVPFWWLPPISITGESAATVDGEG